MQTSAERGKVTAVVARLESACGQGRLPRCPGACHTARDLGVVIDRELSLAAHVTTICSSGYI